MILAKTIGDENEEKDIIMEKEMNVLNMFFVLR